MINDIDRPDVGGNKPKMIGLVTIFKNPDEDLIPFYKVSVSDNIMSNINITGSLDSVETWKQKIWENSRHFRFRVRPEKERRYYIDGEKVTIELQQVCHELKGDLKTFRKYTSTPEKCAEKMKEWLKLCIENQPTQ